MTLSNTSGVYGIFCKANGKVYIGGTVRLRIRRTHHFYSLRQNIHHCAGIQEVFDQYGEDGLTFKVLELVPDAKILNSVEQKWIDFYLEAGLLLNRCKSAGNPKGGDKKRKKAEPYVDRRAAPFKNKEFWLISEDVEEHKVLGLDDLVLTLKSTYPLTLAFINGKKPSLNGFHLLGINDITSNLFTPISEIFFHTFQSPTLEEFNTINVLRLATGMGLGAKTLSTLKNGLCRKNAGWRYLGKTNALTGEFIPNECLTGEVRKRA